MSIMGLRRPPSSLSDAIPPKRFPTTAPANGAAQILPEIRPDNTVFAIVSFEGPDRYSSAGGLGVRVTELAAELAALGFPTHLYFVGDPNRPGEEHAVHGRLRYRRWCSWLSAYHPNGVYDGEDAKVNDYRASVPAPSTC